MTVIHRMDICIFCIFLILSFFSIEKEKEARTKLEALKIQMQLIAEYGRRLLEMVKPAGSPLSFVFMHRNLKKILAL